MASPRAPARPRWRSSPCTPVLSSRSRSSRSPAWARPSLIPSRPAPRPSCTRSANRVV